MGCHCGRNSRVFLCFVGIQHNVATTKNSFILYSIMRCSKSKITIRIYREIGHIAVLFSCRPDIPRWSNMVHYIYNFFKIKQFNYHSLDYFSKNNVTTIEPWGLLSGNEELRSVGVFTGIGHAQPASAIMLQLEIFVGKSFSVNASS